MIIIKFDVLMFLYYIFKLKAVETFLFYFKYS